MACGLSVFICVSRRSRDPRCQWFKTGSLPMLNLRRISQGLFLLLFLFLFIQTETKGNDELGYPVRLFLDFDPLILFTTLLSAHAVAKAFLLSLVVIALTLLLGRVFCGWVCP